MNTLRIEAWVGDSYLGKSIKEMRMIVDYHGERVQKSQILRDIELVACFDQIWEWAGMELKAKLKEEL